MRKIAMLGLMAVLAGCATPSTAPREYLDEQTAATITVVADPWIFTRKNAPPQLDFFNLYAIDVNRMGDHKKYFVVVHYWPGAEFDGGAPPTLVLSGGGQELKLAPASEDARQLGIAQAARQSPHRPRPRRGFIQSIKRACKRSRQGRQLAATLAPKTATPQYVGMARRQLRIERVRNGVRPLTGSLAFPYRRIAPQ